MVGHGEAATRIKFYEENGTELVDKDDPYLYLRYEAADAASSKRKAETAGAATLCTVFIATLSAQCNCICAQQSGPGQC